MPRSPLFIDRENFRQLIEGVPTTSGKNYQDVSTIYGDMSRLVVSWLADTDPSQLQNLYNKWGWGGSANVRAMHECAKEWLKRRSLTISSSALELRSQRSARES
jgi:hypothetical protein